MRDNQKEEFVEKYDCYFISYNLLNPCKVVYWNNCNIIISLSNHIRKY